MKQRSLASGGGGTNLVSGGADLAAAGHAVGVAGSVDRTRLSETRLPTLVRVGVRRFAPNG